MRDFTNKAITSAKVLYMINAWACKPNAEFLSDEEAKSFSNDLYKYYDREYMINSLERFYDKNLTKLNFLNDDNIEEVYDDCIINIINYSNGRHSIITWSQDGGLSYSSYKGHISKETIDKMIDKMIDLT